MKIGTNIEYRDENMSYDPFGFTQNKNVYRQVKCVGLKPYLGLVNRINMSHTFQLLS